MLRRAQILTTAWAAVALGAALVLASCAFVQRVTKPLSPRGAASTSGVGAAPSSVYYAAVDGLKVYSEATSRSKVLGVLSLHEKVTRTRLDRGYAYVESAKRDLKGWVINAKLIWRLPSEPAAGAPAAEEAQPGEQAAPAGEEAPAAAEAAPEAAAPPAAEPAPEAAPVPAAAPQPKATPGGVTPSIFNPY